jgi:hypothetical protein
MNFTRTNIALSLTIIAALGICVLQPSSACGKHHKHHLRKQTNVDTQTNTSGSSNSDAPTKSSVPPDIDKDLRDSNFGPFEVWPGSI